MSSKDDKNNKEYKDSLGLSKQELETRSNLYLSLSTNKEAAFKQLKIQKEIKDFDQKNNEKRTKAGNHYALGNRAGLNQSPATSLEQNYKKADQKFYDQKAQESKASYDQDGSLSKNFKQAQSKGDLSQKFSKQNTDRDER